jgi:UDP-4-amino-4,6-dideoxy-N-acetyl-beta-L-altrosamine transaminase
MIPYGRQNISEDDIKAVVDVLKSDFLTQGPAVKKFEDAISAYTGAKHTTAFANATAALHIAMQTLGVGKGDVVWTSPNSFVASANCALYCGAEVDFVDIDGNTYNMSPDALEEKLKAAKKKPKVVIPVHFAGQSCEMEKIHQLSKKYGFKIVEDASHAIGASYKNKKVGSCVYSDICVFSFHPVKIITTGEGGAATTNDAELAKKMALLRTHGITRETGSDEPWYYEQIDLGYNYRITDIQCALGTSQLSRVDEFVAKRHKIAKKYDEAFMDLPLQTPLQHQDTYSSYHLYPVVLDEPEKRKEVFVKMREAGIGVNVHYIPIHTQPYYKTLGFNTGDFPEAEAYYEGAISLPMYQDLSVKDQDYVIATLKKLL